MAVEKRSHALYEIYIRHLSEDETRLSYSVLVWQTVSLTRKSINTDSYGYRILIWFQNTGAIV